MFFHPFTKTDFPKACILKMLLEKLTCPWTSSLSHLAGLRQSTAFCMQILTGVQSSNRITNTKSCCASILLLCTYCTFVWWSSPGPVWICLHSSGILNTVHIIWQKPSSKAIISAHCYWWFITPLSERQSRSTGSIDLTHDFFSSL